MILRHQIGVLQPWLFVFRCSNLSRHLSVTLQCQKPDNEGRSSPSLAVDPFTGKKKEKKAPYRSTIFLIKSRFKANVKNVKKYELDIQNTSKWWSIYDQQRSQGHRTKEFVLHDGPPYANGELHIGHALNKVLKDITVRQKILDGYTVHYVPGWDCHGLPIELQAVKKLLAGNGPSGNSSNSAHYAQASAAMDPLQLRRIAKEFAMGWMERQQTMFKRWGVLGDWQKPYLTVDRSYVANELRVVATLAERGLLTQENMVVNYSPSSRSTLAESELEYEKDHVSPCVTLGLRAHGPSIPAPLQVLVVYSEA